MKVNTREKLMCGIKALAILWAVHGIGYLIAVYLPMVVLLMYLSVIIMLWMIAMEG